MNVTSFENQYDQTHELKQALVVLGSPGGTSAFTRVLSFCGASLPKHLEPANQANEGFWESSNIMTIHDELLASAGSAWDDFSEFPKSCF